MDKPIPLDLAAHHGDRSLADLICEKYPSRPNYGWRYQKGVKPGEKKLEQFKEVLRLRNTPRLGSQDGLGKDALVMVKLFNPSGSQSWFITEWDGDDEVFCYVTGMAYDEWGSSSLTEMAFLKGKYGIGIEIEMTEPVKPLRDYLKADGKDDDDDEPAEQPGEPEPAAPTSNVIALPVAEERPSLLNRPPPGGWRPEDRVPDHMRKPAPPAPAPDLPTPNPELRTIPMFKALTQLLDTDTVLQLTVSLVDADTLSVVVLPKHLGNDPKRKAVLQQPLHLTASADELDAGFTDAVKSFQTGRMSLDEQVKSALAAAQAAAAESKVNQTKPAPTSGSGKPTKPNPTKPSKPVPMPATTTAPKSTPPTAPAGEKASSGESAPKTVPPAPASGIGNPASTPPPTPTSTVPKPPPGLLGRPGFVPGQLKQPLTQLNPAPTTTTTPAPAAVAAAPLFDGHGD